MKYHSCIFLNLILLFAGGTSPEVKAQLRIVNAFPELNFDAPVDIQTANDGTNRMFVVEQRGVISVFQNDSNVTAKATFLDISDKVLYGGEQGLLGLAFHPQYKQNGYFFVNYTASNPRRTVIARYKVSENNPDKADPQSELIFLEVEQPYSNHNGGQISFGPDGFLYNSFGDGGSGGDPGGNGQNLNTLLGSIIRIDVNTPTNTKQYSIPQDNPFVNTQNAKPEIYAYGLRNVWRFSFDKVTGKLWAADVGQNLWEEIDIIEKGKNYGWNIMEGFHCYNSQQCNQEGLEPPVWEYGHNSAGGYSITGGFVYRGINAEEIYGKYIFADFVSGKIWALTQSGNGISNELIFETNYSISTFGIDESNDLYFADYNSGKIFKIIGEKTTSVGKLEIPDFELKQNYPNPFNPTTTIKYSIATSSPFAKGRTEQGFVTLKIYDVLGREITTLVNKNQPPGKYEVIFDAGNLPSGTYFYRLSALNFISGKKMVLLK